MSIYQGVLRVAGQEIAREFARRDNENFGYWTTRDLVDAGLTRRMIQHLLDTLVIHRQRRGIYTSRSATRSVVVAARANGRVGCLSAAELRGVWIPPGHGRHVIVERSRREIKGKGTHFHRIRTVASHPVYDTVDSLKQILRYHDAETGLVSIESAVNLGHISIQRARSLIEEQTSSKQRTLRMMARGAQSGSETRVRLFLQIHRVEVQTQVLIEGVGRVDLLARGDTIIELDGREFHAGPTYFEQDRQRDLEAKSRGYRVIRLSYKQVWFPYMWDRTRAFLCEYFGVKQRIMS